MSDSRWPANYEIRVEGFPDPAWFEDFDVTRDAGHTIVSGQLVDQSALHGLLARVRDLGLCLISVRRLDTEEDRTGEAGMGR
jgi:hypothetical protein